MSKNKTMNNKHLKEAFDLLDYSGEGKLDIQKILDNLTKMGYDKSHPEIFDLFNSFEGDYIEYDDFCNTISTLMNIKEDDEGLQRMFDLLLYDQKMEEINFDTLKKISEENGNVLSDTDIKFALNEIGNGKTISIDSFIEFMKEK